MAYEAGPRIPTNNTKPLTSIAKSKPEEAANNIKTAQKIGVPPEAYKEHKDLMDEAIKEQEEIVDLPEPVAQRMVASTEHTSVIKEDASTWDQFRRYLNFVGDTIEGKSIGRDIADLARKKAFNIPLSEEEEFELLKLNHELKELNSNPEHGYTFWESVPAEVAGTTTDFLESFWDNIDLTLFGAGTGAVAYGTMGLAAGPKGALAGGIIGLKKGGSYWDNDWSGERCLQTIDWSGLQ